MKWSHFPSKKVVDLSDSMFARNSILALMICSVPIASASAQALSQDTLQSQVESLRSGKIQDTTRPESKLQWSLINLQTSLGLVQLKINHTQAPKTAQNFVDYAQSGFYNGTIFHRVISNFMVQGGGFNPNMQEKPTRSPIVNESHNNLKNVRGSIAMARTNNPNSATSQFFINLRDNPNLDATSQRPGYAVFGHVSHGMDVIDKMAQQRTGLAFGHHDVPTTVIMIESATVGTVGKNPKSTANNALKPLRDVKHYYELIADRVRTFIQKP